MKRFPPWGSTRWSLATQLRLGFGVAFLLILGVSGAAWWVALDYRDGIEVAYRTHLRTTMQLAEAESAFWQLRYRVPRFMVASAEEQQQILAEQDQGYGIVEERLAAYRETAHDAEEKRALTSLRAAYLRYKLARPKFFELWVAGEKDDAIAWNALTTAPFGTETVRAFHAQIALQRSIAQREEAKVTEHVRTALVLVTAITIALLALLVTGYIYSVLMLRPIRVLHKEAQRVVREQLGEIIDTSASSNEVAALVESFRMMSDRLLAHTESLRQFAAELETKVASRTEELAIALEAATESDRLKSDFMANVTHELRTPLNSVIGFAELLKDEVPGPLNAKQAAFADDILASGQRLLALVEGILEMSRLDAAGAALKREPAEIGAAIEERMAAHRRSAEARDVTMRLDVTPDAGSADLDPTALRRMLDALLDNAIKFNCEGGTVAVRARRAGGALEIAVADTGIGIAQEDLAKLFKPLVQLDAGLARRHGGVGLGLALARRLAELHGGTIDVESEPGKGSTFTLRLPVAVEDDVPNCQSGLFLAEKS